MFEFFNSGTKIVRIGDTLFKENMKGLIITFLSDKDFIYFLPGITLYADKMLHPFRTNYFLRMGFLHWQIRITWYKEGKNGIQRNI